MALTGPFACMALVQDGFLGDDGRAASLLTQKAEAGGVGEDAAKRYSPAHQLRFGENHSLQARERLPALRLDQFNRKEQDGAGKDFHQVKILNFSGPDRTSPRSDDDEVPTAWMEMFGPRFFSKADAANIGQ
ncbi:MAG TPA: hypothetical protein VHS96_15480 [Bacteroidia bacterium]|nr:hypothetical protein [Bacteroidia bacterium]